MKIIQKHIEEIKELCEKHKVINLYVFGSLVNDTSNSDSDIDFLVEFGEVNLPDYYDNYISFKSGLQALFGRNIDLLEQQTLKNPILKKSIDRNKKLIYERADSEMAVEAISEIESYFEETPLDLKTYQTNIMLKRAVERDLEIIGEAVNRIIKKDADFPIPNARKIVGLRNEIIHAYDGISDENIYSILMNHLPQLKEEIYQLIEQADVDT